ncbi:outer membrane protein assembly factor BamD [Flavobacteriaceae bacterium 14752]|uniref:outer membrane protein assembly factor BamD n=1 Tax=Mesohalobacter salilacus TaxID=2491711 RepID=UPI000F63B635|nr:outer membrane protein assembly factor BamD [Flavobacteriaceae bacterium 14752]
MKQLFYILSAFVLLTSCSEYQKVLKQKEIKPKFDLANRFYEEGLKEEKNRKLTKAIKLYEQILPSLQGKPQSEIVQFNVANAYYSIGDHLISGYKFERFTKAYPTSQKVEEAMFKSAESYYHESPRYSLDQTDTRKAIDKLQIYINEYPDGQYFAEANDKLQELRYKIEKKYYEIAKQYHHTYRYKAAISDFENYLVKYPGSAFKEQTYYYRFESAYLLAINSFRSLVEERLETALVYFDDYKSRYPEGEFIKQAQEYANDAEVRIAELKTKNIQQQ